MNLSNQLLQYSEQERLALISCITSIASDKVSNQEEIDFVLTLIEAADMDAIKMKTAADYPATVNSEPKTERSLQNKRANHFRRNQALPLIRFSDELPSKTNHFLQELEIDSEHVIQDDLTEKESSSVEKMILSLYLSK